MYLYSIFPYSVRDTVRASYIFCVKAPKDINPKIPTDLIKPSYLYLPIYIQTRD